MVLVFAAGALGRSSYSVQERKFLKLLQVQPQTATAAG